MNKARLKFSDKLEYGIGDFGCNLLSAAAGAFITMYYTDSILISAAFVGTMMLFTRFLDGISDIIMGIIIDNTKSKYGKARPWILIGAVPLAISFILLFHVPAGLGDAGTKIYVTCTYIFYTVVCATVINLAYSSLCTMMSPDVNERISLSGIRMFFASMATLLGNSYTMTLVLFFGGNQKGFGIISIIYGIISAAVLLITGITCKEYKVEDIKEKLSEKKKLDSKKAISYLFRNKYTIPLIIGFVTNWIAMSLSGSAMPYYARDVLGNFSYITVIAMARNLPTIIVLLLGLVSKYIMVTGKRNAMMTGAFMQIAAFLLLIIAPLNLALQITGNIIIGISMGILNTTFFSTVTDVADYINIKNDTDITGLTNSITSFGLKVGVGLGSAALGWLLAIGNYNGQAANAGLVQADTAIFSEKVCYAILPLICMLIVAIISRFIDVDKKVAGMRKEQE